MTPVASIREFVYKTKSREKLMLHSGLRLKRERKNRNVVAGESRMFTHVQKP